MPRHHRVAVPADRRFRAGRFAEPGGHSRNWSLMNRLNQKGTRPQDTPVALTHLTAGEQALIRRHYLELL